MPFPKIQMIQNSQPRRKPPARSDKITWMNKKNRALCDGPGEIIAARFRMVAEHKFLLFINRHIMGEEL